MVSSDLFAAFVVLVAHPDLRAEPHQRVELPVRYALLHRDDRVVGDLDALGADLGAALGDVAHAEAGCVLGHLDPVVLVQRVHVQLGVPEEEAGSGEGRLVLLVVTDDVAGVLAQEALDALAELLAALDVDLGHPTLAVGIARAEIRVGQLLGLLVVERDVRDQVPDHREGAHRGDGDGLVLLEVREPAHAHQPRLAVDLGAARAALAGLAVPTHGEVAGLGALHAVDRVQDHLALGDLDRVVLDLTAGLVAAPDPQLQGVGHQFFPSSGLAADSKYFLSSSGITGSGFSARSTPVPAELRVTTRFLVPHSG